MDTNNAQLWTEIAILQHQYVSALDSGNLEAWPQFFTEDCRYEIIPKENVDAGLPAPVIYCRNQKMLRDRVTSLRNANIYESHTYRHLVSGLVLTNVAQDTVQTTSSYVVVITGLTGESSIYQAGAYQDEVVKANGVWRYRAKRVMYDTLRVQTLLATPI
ncbi:ring hydroxylating beta subunit [Paraburkholderia xenovorans LB400]|jgi:anthranilate 1,2-dioxygenase small subunit|uniref:Aromatic-ring-hydroxylating dioxygenase, beta subunit n=5 Tax=Pseudomonadota TaxID=1224 RepID=A0A024HIW6_PSEKB|nr:MULTISPECIES: anthranilate 1,2-dioxygenase small subunit AndAd [Pseudomonadota]ABE31845.1 Aromatic-ring-hydroxylating dioxygenase, beta subunit [Paraburkholderia xenovorans LB400]AIP30542.1 ring hydroxylating beta subunit [Paraburkholderia xenovorans LB400]ANC47669.1 anthranilate 1,2-dioxygenase [Pandoraea pnomenusa]MBO9332237.1 anthranilate 1,2-dioxygenase [Achromobacter xylosoxidans]MCT9826917.1 aromatic-ring-hydroxylating dioxygenase subunit beta [Pseudomonas veronii]